MLTAREIMTPDAECIGEDDSLTEAAQRLRDLGVGSMPICGADNRLKGMLTDRDIVVEGVAVGKDPAKTRAGDFGGEKPVTIGADDSVDEAIATMEQHQVRRLPVIDGHDLIGMIAQPDIARALPEDQAGELVKLVSW